MKVYLISHKGKPSIIKMEAWARTCQVGDNGVFVQSINAFLRKRDAEKWLKENCCEHLEIKIFEYKE